MKNNGSPNPGGDKKVIRMAEKRRVATFWRKHVASLREKKLLRDSSLQTLTSLGVTEFQNIGYEEKQIRPIMLGKYDVYLRLRGKVSEAERFFLSDLTPHEVISLERNHRLKTTGMNPNDQVEIAQFKQTECVSKEEINRQLEEAPMINAEIDSKLESFERSLADFD